MGFIDSIKPSILSLAIDKIGKFNNRLGGGKIGISLCRLKSLKIVEAYSELEFFGI